MKWNPVDILNPPEHKTVRYFPSYSDCLNMLRRLRSLDVAEPFNSPVSGIPGYYEIIKMPMDLSTLESNMESQQYKCPEEYLSDMRRVFFNALTFNRHGDSVHFMALIMLSVFEGDWGRSCARLSALSKPPAHYAGGNNGARWDTTQAVDITTNRTDEKKQEVSVQVPAATSAAAPPPQKDNETAAALPSGKPPKRNKGGQSLVGRRLQVWWEGDQCWYKGRIEVGILSSAPPLSPLFSLDFIFLSLQFSVSLIRTQHFLQRGMQCVRESTRCCTTMARPSR